MATSREERMHQRLRGAQRHQVEDLSFGFVFPVDEEVPAEEPGLEPQPEPEPEPVPVPARSPTLGAQRALSPPLAGTGRVEDALVSDTPARSQRRSVVPATSSSRVQSDLYDMPDNTEAEIGHPTSRSSRRRTTEIRRPQSRSGYEEVTESPADAPGSGHRRRVRISAAANQTASLQEVLLADSDPAHTVASSSPLERKTRRARSSIAATSRLSINTAAASASGSRLSARLSQASSSTPGTQAREVSPELTDKPGATPVFNSPAVDNVDELSPDNPIGGSSVAQSSPLARALQKRRASGALVSKAKAARTSSRPARPPGGDVDADELSPKPSEASERSPQRRTSNAPKSLSLVAIPEESRQTEGPAPSDEEVGIAEAGEPDEGLREEAEGKKPDEESQEEAEEVNDQEAARRLGRKRLRRSLPAPSPELGSAAEKSVVRPTKRRRAVPMVSSPIRQKQPPKAQRAPAKKPEPARRRAKKRAAPPQDSGPEVDTSGEPISVPVQRFIRVKGPGGGESDEDELVSSIPFSSREGVTSVDILRQLCEEVTAGVLRTLKEKAGEAEDAASRRELVTKARALEAFREELRTKLIEHTIALDSLHTLRKRFRASQKEKRSLRDEILRLRAERDEAALRMDALRMKHETEAQKVLRNIQISSAMHDIELAAEEGRSAPELPAAEQKKAELANLELLMQRVGGQVCASGPGISVLDQVKNFNTYLERAAAALQAR